MPSQHHAFPGCAFGVLAGGEIVLADALGRFTYEDDSPPVKPHTVFDVASITKVVSTTAAAMLLYQRGMLDLDTPLGELLPGFVVGRDERIAWRARSPFGTCWRTTPACPDTSSSFVRSPLPPQLYRACLELPLEADAGRTRASTPIPGFILLGKALEVLTREDLAALGSKRDISSRSVSAATRFSPPTVERPLDPANRNR